MRHIASATSVPARCVLATLAKCSLAAVAAIAAVAGCGNAWCAPVESPATKVARGEPSGREIVERGTIESAQSTIVRCEVAWPDSSGTAIVQIVPDGTVVQLGEVLVKLDSTIREEEAKRQQIAVTEASAAAKRARDDLETVKLAKREYLEGTYVVQLKSIQNDIFIAESQLRRASEDLKTLDQPGGQAVPPRQLEDVRFVEKKARNELDIAKTRLQTLQTLTKDKMLRQLGADLDAAEARVKIEEANLKLAQEWLAFIQLQVANCTIRAKVAGTAVYEKIRTPGGNVTLIGEGRSVAKGQTILRVADASQLQVKIRVDSSQAPLLKVRMKATVAVQKDSPLLAATVASFGAESVSRLGAKDYEVVLTFDEPPGGLGLRIGQSVEVRIPVRGVAATTTPPRARVDVQRDQLFDLWDKNRDGLLEESEVPSPTLWEHLKRFDANGDGLIDRAEWKKMQEALPPVRGR